MALASLLDELFRHRRRSMLFNDRAASGEWFVTTLLCYLSLISSETGVDVNACAHVSVVVASCETEWSLLLRRAAIRAVRPILVQSWCKEQVGATFNNASLTECRATALEHLKLHDESLFRQLLPGV